MKQLTRYQGSDQDLAWPIGMLAAVDETRFASYREAQDFYDGAQWMGRPRPGEARLTFNYARTMVRKVASYAFPAPVQFTIASDGDDAAANRAELTLAQAIRQNDLAILDVEMAIESSVLGDAAMKVTWDAVERRPVVAAVDPASLIAWTAPGRPRQVIRITQSYWMAGAAIGGLLDDPAAIGGLDPSRHYPVVEEWSADRWQMTVAGQTVRDEPNPYGWLPYVLLHNNPRPHQLWGASDLIDLYDVCRQINARMSVLARVLELSGAPIAVLENVEGSEGIQVGPGARWELPEGSKAYLLDLLGGGGVGLHVEYVNLLYRSLHDLAETPRTAFGDSGRALSGAALEVEIQPLVQKVGRKRLAWEGVYRERNARLLDLLERFGGETIGGLRQTATVWPGVLPGDVDGAVRNAVSLVSAGIQSRRTALAELGGTDPEREWQRVQEEAADSTLTSPVMAR